MQIDGRNPRLRTLCAILLCACLGYIGIALSIERAPPRGSEQVFGEPRLDDGPQLRIYVEIIAVDAVNDSVRLRVDFATNALMKGARAGTANQDLRFRLENTDYEREFVFPAQQNLGAETIDLGLNDGNIADFPLDRFSAELDLSASDPSGAPLPLNVTVWDGIAGWSPSITQAEGSSSRHVQLRFKLSRSLPLRILVLAVYGEMVLIAMAALTIGGRIFLGLRPPESTLTGALTGMVFSLPALRYALPGSVPLGVHADLLVFFWAEFAVAIGFSLFIVAWARVRIKS